MAATTKKDTAEKVEAVQYLRGLLRPGDTVYTICRHVSGSGMSRRLDLYTIRDNRMLFLTGYVSKALGYRRHRDKDGMTVGGCGMDVGFGVVYNLGCALWPQGTPEPHGTRNGEPDTCGGYALKHEWL